MVTPYCLTQASVSSTATTGACSSSARTHRRGHRLNDPRVPRRLIPHRDRQHGREGAELREVVVVAAYRGDVTVSGCPHHRMRVLRNASAEVVEQSVEPQT